MIGKIKIENYQKKTEAPPGLLFAGFILRDGCSFGVHFLPNFCFFVVFAIVLVIFFWLCSLPL